jgi:hypothetical protein
VYFVRISRRLSICSTLRSSSARIYPWSPNMIRTRVRRELGCTQRFRACGWVTQNISWLPSPTLPESARAWTSGKQTIARSTVLSPSTKCIQFLSSIHQPWLSNRLTRLDPLHSGAHLHLAPQLRSLEDHRRRQARPAPRLWRPPRN